MSEQYFNHFLREKESMIKSMTGFSKSLVTEHGMSATVELKSVNGRYLEVNVRMPRSISHHEFDVREQIKKHLMRGSVSVTIGIEHTSGKNAPMIISEDAASAVFQTLGAIKKKLKIKEPVTLENVLVFSEQLLVSEATDLSESEWKVVNKALHNALRDMDTMRKNEGKELAADLHKRIKLIEESLIIVENRAAKRVPEERERLRARIGQLFESDEIDEQRLQMEIVLLADKLDISEECVRLRSHIKFFNETMKSVDAGRKLNFLLQEMHREVNTIGSKANDAEVAHNVVSMKEELEKMREQVQNIE
ncbi:MAG: YicC/YloC family endoribonuclease [Candidatus Kapaibacterium sp.]|jgi:uncharacterized protein (TIGR00255 family)